MNTFLNSMLSFEKMMAEQLVKIVYYIGLVAIAFGFIGGVFKSLTSGFLSFFPSIIGLMIVTVLGILLWRMICEQIIILFRIYSRLGNINSALGGTNAQPKPEGEDPLETARNAAIKAKAVMQEKAELAKAKAAELSEKMAERAKDTAEDMKEGAQDLRNHFSNDETSDGALAAKPVTKASPAKKPAAKKPAVKPAAKPTAKSSTGKKPAPKK